MARISTYAIDSNFTSQDKLLGSDENGMTRNFQIGPITPGGAITTSVVNYITECDPRSLAFEYHNSNFAGYGVPQPGRVSHPTSTTSTASFGTVTSLIVSKLPWAQHIALATANTCEQILAEYVNFSVKFSNVANPNEYGIYVCDQVSQHPTYTDQMLMTLTHLSSNGSFSHSPQKIYVLEPWTAGDKHFEYTLTASEVAALTGFNPSVTITHNLNKKPKVHIERDTGSGYESWEYNQDFNVEYTSNNQCRIILAPFSFGFNSGNYKVYFN